MIDGAHVYTCVLFVLHCIVSQKNQCTGERRGLLVADGGAVIIAVDTVPAPVNKATDGVREKEGDDDDDEARGE